MRSRTVSAYSAPEGAAGGRVAGRRRRLDWPAIEADYRSGLHSLRQMAASHGCAPSTIANKATRAGWQRRAQERPDVQPLPAGATAPPAQPGGRTRRAVPADPILLMQTALAPDRRDAS